MKFYVKLGLILITTVTLSACISQSVHQQKLDENQHLQSVIKGLEADYERLKEDKKQLIERNDSLSQRLLEAIEHSKLLQEDLMR